MAAELAFIVTDTGDTISFYMDSHTGRLLVTADDGAVPPPASLSHIAQARKLLQDPLDTRDIVIVQDTLPDTGAPNTLYIKSVSYDGVCWQWDGAQWLEAVTRFGNAAIDAEISVYKGSVYNAVMALLTQWEAAVDPDTYYTSANSGAESISWPSLADRAAWFAARRNAIKALATTAAGKVSGGGYTAFSDVPIGKL
jgi:hypothetical protein